VTTAGSPALAVLIALAVMAGCAPRTLDVGYPVKAEGPAPGPDAGRRIVVTVTDRRVDQTRIGSRPEDGTPILTSRPVADIVRAALVAELGRTGHAPVAAGDVAVTADVEDFWLDSVGRAGATLYVGRVVIAVAITEPATGERRLQRRYIGVARRTGEADARDVWRGVMDAALTRAIHDLATDPDLGATGSQAMRRAESDGFAWPGVTAAQAVGRLHVPQTGNSSSSPSAFS
jgi:hypothetical protein